ncbi:MAG: KEOPS complex subunit Pcc1 [archaeon]
MKEFPFFLDLELFFPSKEKAEKAFRAVNPELKSEKMNRSTTKVILKKNSFSINIKAKDKTALKASINSLMKSINLSFSLIGGK